MHAERQPDLAGACHSEFRYGQFCARVSLPASVDDYITASYADGVLELSLGLEDEHAARKISVATGAASRG